MLKAMISSLPAGLFGSRADLLTDLSLLTFIVLPFIMPLGFRLAAKQRLHAHRRVQVGFLAIMTIAVLVLEVDIRLRGGSCALAGKAVSVPPPAVRALLLVHLLIAVSTWLLWIGFVVRSWRRFGSSLPGDFSRTHRRWGRILWLGVGATAGTGTLLYIAAFVL